MQTSQTSLVIITQLLTSLILCVLIFIHKRRDIQFKVVSERQIFEKLFMAVFFTSSISAENLLRGSCHRFIYCQSFCQESTKIYFLHILLIEMSDLGFESWPNLIKQHTTYQTTASTIYRHQLLTPLMSSALIVYMSGETYSLKSTSNDRFLRNFSQQFYLLSQFLPEIF